MKRVIAAFFITLMLITNMGFAMATHYCGGHAMKSSFSMFAHDLDCGMENMEVSCETPSNIPVVKSEKCCENQVISVDVEDDYNAPEHAKVNIDFQFFAAYIITYTNLYSYNTTNDFEYDKYSPPLPDQDIHVMIQSFLL